ncbi:hypothetical protein BH09MYX1_BH09MYX1_13860 [soil metagenome]
MLAVALSFASACRTVYKPEFVATADYLDIDAKAPFLKCHLRDGGVVVLRDFHVDAVKRIATGIGLRYDQNRKRVGEVKAQTVDL